MADYLADEEDLDWSGMSDEERALALLAAYRNLPGATREKLDGIWWLRLPGANLVELGNKVSGLGKVALGKAHKLLLTQGLRQYEGSGRTTVHWVRADDQPEGDTSDKVASVSDEELIVRAAERISELEAQVTELQAARDARSARQLTARERLSLLLSKNDKPQ